MKARNDLHMVLLRIRAAAQVDALHAPSITEWVDEALRYFKDIPVGDLKSDELWRIMLEWRNDIEPNRACGDCGGSGYKTYANTATWHHASIAGQALTTDICDMCWGSGDKTQPWRDLRKNPPAKTTRAETLRRCAAIAHRFCFMPAVDSRMENDAAKIEDEILSMLEAE